MKRKIVILSLILLSMIVGLVLAYFKFIAKDINIGQPDSAIIQNLYHDSFDLKASYVGDSTWEYTLTGSLPNPCYSLSIDPVVMESYPEQVIVKIHISENSNPDLACIQVIEEVKRSGVFNASPEAIISLEIVQ